MRAGGEQEENRRRKEEREKDMASVEMMLLYAGQQLDSYVASIDSAEIFCGLHELHDPNCIWYPLR